MGYTDEDIIKMRRKIDEAEQARHSSEAVQEEVRQSIYDEVVHIYDIPVQFKEHEILDGRATLRMPEDFMPRSKEEIREVYFLGNSPQYVYSNDYLYFMISLNFTENRIPNVHIPDFMGFAKKSIERVGPKARFIDEAKILRPNSNLGVLEFTSNTIDSVNFNTMFLASMDDRLVIGSVTFAQKYAKRLRPIGKEIALSFAIQEKMEV